MHVDADLGKAGGAAIMIGSWHWNLVVERKLLESRELESTRAVLILVLVLLLIRCMSTRSCGMLVVHWLCIPGVG